MSEHDPRTDPRPGDVLSGDWPKRVDNIDGGTVNFTRLSEVYCSVRASMSVEKWRKYNKRAKVLHRAEDQP